MRANFQRVASLVQPITPALQATFADLNRSGHPHQDGYWSSEPQIDFTQADLRYFASEHGQQHPTMTGLPATDSSTDFRFQEPFMAGPMSMAQQPVSYPSQQTGMVDLQSEMPYMADFDPLAGVSSHWPGILATDNNMMYAPFVAHSGPVQVIPFPAPVVPFVQSNPASIIHTTTARFSCTYCMQTFARDQDRIRHEDSKHLNPGAHVCPIVGCPKNLGQGFSRADKLTEHMWKKHAALGYTKRV